MTGDSSERRKMRAYKEAERAVERVTEEDLDLDLELGGKERER
jgi:hypothetical protein